MSPLSDGKVPVFATTASLSLFQNECRLKMLGFVASDLAKL